VVLQANDGHGASAVDRSDRADLPLLHVDRTGAAQPPPTVADAEFGLAPRGLRERGLLRRR
jgi:hypothetical protein